MAKRTIYSDKFTLELGRFCGRSGLKNESLLLVYPHQNLTSKKFPLDIRVKIFDIYFLMNKHLEFFYLHNCVYEKVWRDNQRRRTETLDIEEIIRTFGSDYMNRLTNHFTKVAWLNPQPEPQWSYYHSIDLINELIDSKMFPLTVDGIGREIKEIS